MFTQGMTTSIRTVALGSILFASSPAFAGGGSYMSQTVNFLLLVAILGFIITTKLPPLFRNRAESIKSGLEQGQKELEIAQHRHQEVSERFNALEETIKNIEVETAEDIGNMKAHFSARMEEERIMIENNAKFAIQDEILRAKQELQDESVEIAMKLAEDLIKNTITDEDHSNFKQQFINAVEKEGSNV